MAAHEGAHFFAHPFALKAEDRGNILFGEKGFCFHENPLFVSYRPL